MRAVVDLDMIKYAAAAAGEKRTIKAVHKSTGDEFDCKTRTEFYGHWIKKEGGILKDFNETNGKDYVAEDFEIIDIQKPEPIENVLHTAKMMFKSALHLSQAESYEAYLGKGDSFRVALSTLLKYKGNRDDLLIPLALPEVTEYLIKTVKPEIITGIEADDAVVMSANGDRNKVVLGVDKDYRGCNVLLMNPNKPEEGVLDCSGFGSLWIDAKGKVTGKGRIFFYFQVLSKDVTDNYAANCFSDIAWADKSAYKVLAPCKDDKQALAALVKAYQYLYPEPKVVTGWKGNEIEIDWLYVARENWHMARMLRWEGDNVDLTDVLTKFKLLGG